MPRASDSTLDLPRIGLPRLPKRFEDPNGRCSSIDKGEQHSVIPTEGDLPDVPAFRLPTLNSFEFPGSVEFLFRDPISPVLDELPNSSEYLPLTNCPEAIERLGRARVELRARSETKQPVLLLGGDKLARPVYSDEDA